MKKLLKAIMTILSAGVALPVSADIADPSLDIIPNSSGNLTLAMVLLGFSGLLFLSLTALVIIIGIVAYLRKQRVGKPRS